MHEDTLAEEHSEEDRRIYKWRFDKNINISAVIAAVILLWTIASYGNAIIEAQKMTGRKVNIMWEYFVKDKPELQNLFKDQY